MQPTLNPVESSQADRILINRWSAKLLHRYERGQVVLLRSPHDPDLLILKRLIGLEGDWVVVPNHTDIETVPQGHCWVEGDNPACSMDSRTAYGSVPLGLIQGRASCIIWPPERVSWVDSHAPTNRLLMTNQQALQRTDSSQWFRRR
ncbi:hypothetical protein WJX74_008674 [Apatococcus lobatus]|uniref:Mitochondrial inner membrane protease subunit 2 n=1 Tax=Apatococcus lobatus TaxID=904363 RepID=A0AAW1SFH4_9CHLO